MTFFIQSCPACARRFQVHLRALGKQVECQYCYSIFNSFDGTEDVGEASDPAEQWARDQWARDQTNEQDADDPLFGHAAQDSDFPDVTSDNMSPQNGQQKNGQQRAGSSTYRPR